MSRRKNIETLRGMGNEPRALYVYRDKQWSNVSAETLVPGDIISVIRHSNKDEIVPCDCLLLQGSAIVNEAALTGESVPQLKENIVLDADTRVKPLDMKLTDKAHILYGGTRMLQCNTAMIGAGEGHSIAPPPDHGCICYVLRTGFSSSQV
jgi:cation-transporting ATPase 13A1